MPSLWWSPLLLWTRRRWRCSCMYHLKLAPHWSQVNKLAARWLPLMWVTSDVLLDRHALQMWQKNLLETSDWSAIVRARLVSIPRWLDDPVAPAANCQHWQYRHRWRVVTVDTVLQTIRFYCYICSSGICTASATKKKMELAQTYIKKKWWQHCQASTTVDTTRLHRNGVTKQHLEKSHGEREVDSSLQVQLAAAQDRAGWRQVLGGLHSTRNNKALVK